MYIHIIRIRHMHTHTCTHACMHAHTHTYTYTHTRTHTHTHTHMHALIHNTNKHAHMCTPRTQQMSRHAGQRMEPLNVFPEDDTVKRTCTIGRCNNRGDVNTIYHKFAGMSNATEQQSVKQCFPAIPPSPPPFLFLFPLPFPLPLVPSSPLPLPSSFLTSFPSHSQDMFTPRTLTVSPPLGEQENYSA